MELSDYNFTSEECFNSVWNHCTFSVCCSFILLQHGCQRCRQPRSPGNEDGDQQKTSFRRPLRSLEQQHCNNTRRALSPGQTRKHCFLSMFRHVSQSGQALGNISKKHRETSNVSEFARKHFCFSGNFVSATMFPRVGKHGSIWGNIENHKCPHNSVS